MKKVTLGHLSKKHDIPMKELRMLLVEEGLIKPNGRKVEKKPAKALIRAFQKNHPAAGTASSIKAKKSSKKSSKSKSKKHETTHASTGWFGNFRWAQWLIGALALIGFFSYLKNTADSLQTDKAVVVQYEDQLIGENSVLFMDSADNNDPSLIVQNDEIRDSDDEIEDASGSEDNIDAANSDNQGDNNPDHASGPAIQLPESLPETGGL